MKRSLAVLVALVVLVLVAAGIVFFYMLPGPLPANGKKPGPRVINAATMLIERGEYLARAGDSCAARTSIASNAQSC
jgi:hypothetical protein